MNQASPARQKLGALVIQAGFVAAALVWIAVAWASMRQTPGWEGVLTGVFVGFFTALLTALGGAMLALAIGRARKPEPAVDERPLEGSLAATLEELEQVRQRTVRQIKARSLLTVPLGGLAGAGAWWLAQHGDDPPGPAEIVVFIGVGGFLGYSWAAAKLGAAYRRLYKARVLPALARQFGDLTWRPAQAPLDELKRHRLFGPFDAARAEDEIVGEHRGLPLSILELHLTRGSGKNRRTVFHGLLTSVTLPRALRGVTVVVSDKGLGNLAELLPGGRAGARVRVEDPEFEKIYEVYGTDQVGARALLTPAFMTRFVDFARSGRFGAPLVLAQDNRVTFALSRAGGDLFEPPSWWRPAAGREAIRQMSGDIESVLAAADAVIDLDHAGRLAG